MYSLMVHVDKRYEVCFVRADLLACEESYFYWNPSARAVDLVPTLFSIRV